MTIKRINSGITVLFAAKRYFLRILLLFVYIILIVNNKFYCQQINTDINYIICVWTYRTLGTDAGIKARWSTYVRAMK